MNSIFPFAGLLFKLNISFKIFLKFGSLRKHSPRKENHDDQLWWKNIKEASRKSEKANSLNSETYSFAKISHWKCKTKNLKNKFRKIPAERTNHRGESGGDGGREVEEYEDQVGKLNFELEKLHSKFNAK